MASCYHCGRSGASYRRDVVTGNSYGMSFSNKGRSSYSTRVYSGLRTLCEDCAFNVDKRRLIGNIVGGWILIVILLGLIIFLNSYL